jgi:MYXO-CTERM domain-containing protein
VTNVRLRKLIGAAIPASTLLAVALAFAYEPGPSCEMDGECNEGKACHFWDDPGAAPSAGAMGTCEDEGFGDECESDEQCQGDLVCSAGYCAPADIPAASPSSGEADPPEGESDTTESDAGDSSGEGCSVRSPGPARSGTGVLLLVVAGVLGLRRRQGAGCAALR